MLLEKVTTNNDIPTLKITLPEEGKRNIGYLHPFRGYKFQVSGSVNGEGDYGSTDVVGLGNIVQAFKAYKFPDSRSSLFASNDPDLAREIFRNMALVAMAKFGYPIRSLSCEDYQLFDQFINECVEWVTKEVDKVLV